MSDIAVALIGAASSVFVGILAFFGVVMTNSKSNREMQHKLDVSQAITDTKIEQLTTEVRHHNNFAQRMPVVEQEIKAINHRIKDLENLHKREV